MIEVAQLNDLAVRVSGFRRQKRDERPSFQIVLLIPGQSASDDVSRVLAMRHLTLTLFLENGEKEQHEVSVTAHEIQQTGHPLSPVYRHQIELVEQLPEDALEPNAIEEELAAIMIRLERLIDALARSGVLKREVIEDRVRKMRDAGP